MRNLSSIVWGLLLIIIGIILGGNALDFWNIDILFNGWWTFFIIVPCFINLLQHGFRKGNVIGLLIGGALLFSCWGVFPWGTLWKLAVPALLVIIGLGALFNLGNRKKKYNMSSEGYHDHVSSFCSSTENHVMNEEYLGGKVNAVMGSSVLDLRSAVIPGDIRIRADVFMGSAEIFFPPYVQLVVNSSPFLGAVENKTQQSVTVNAPTVFLDCSAVLGSIELK